MKIMIVVGARPNFMKVAPIVAAIDRHNENAFRHSSDSTEGGPPEVIRQILVHTGQHYGESMSNAFFEDLNLPTPDIHLGVGSGSHAAQTAEIMRQFEGVLIRESPDVVVVVGDVNSTVACALVASKISFDSNGARPLIAHVEAGLRSFDRGMPEEINRILTDHLSDLLFVTEGSGTRNLAQEGMPAERVHFVGNTMIDSLLACRAKAAASTILDDLGLRHTPENGYGHAVTRYALLTLHRPSNVDNRDTFMTILEGLEELSKECPIVFPVHPRTLNRILEFGLEHFFDRRYLRPERAGLPPINRSGAIRITEPLGYLDFLCLMSNAALVVTDSGGIQEETTCLGVRCVTVRENTERPVTITVGTNALAGVTKDGILKTIRRQLASNLLKKVPEKWDGQTADRILEVICSKCNKEKSLALELNSASR
jgi:UDP-N-acetylglucosamine 2-epimerase (non-hydrolysing)